MLIFVFSVTFCEQLWCISVAEEKELDFVCAMFACRQQSSGGQMNPSELTVHAGDITAFKKVINLIKLI